MNGNKTVGEVMDDDVGGRASPSEVSTATLGGWYAGGFGCATDWYLAQYRMVGTMAGLVIVT